MLKKLLSEFWDWAQISFEEYCADESCFYTKYRWEVEEFHFPLVVQSQHSKNILVYAIL